LSSTIHNFAITVSLLIFNPAFLWKTIWKNGKFWDGWSKRKI